MFTKRHYTWLAEFAGERLDNAQTKALAQALYAQAKERDIPGNFKPGYFIIECANQRALIAMRKREGK